VRGSRGWKLRRGGGVVSKIGKMSINSMVLRGETSLIIEEVIMKIGKRERGSAGYERGDKRVVLR
jgi:hypothetical protein